MVGIGVGNSELFSKSFKVRVSYFYGNTAGEFVLLA